MSRTVAFAVSLHNKGMDDLAKIGVRLYVMSGPNSPDVNQTRQQLRVAKVLSQDDLSVASMQDVGAEMGEVDFAAKTVSDPGKVEPNGQGGSVVVTTTYYSGYVYRGYVAEIYLDGKLADVRIGNGAMKKAYEEYLANPDGAPPKPHPRPAPSVWPPPAQLPP